MSEQMSLAEAQGRYNAALTQAAILNASVADQKAGLVAARAATQGLVDAVANGIGKATVAELQNAKSAEVSALWRLELAEATQKAGQRNADQAQTELLRARVADHHGQKPGLSQALYDAGAQFDAALAAASIALDGLRAAEESLNEHIRTGNNLASEINSAARVNAILREMPKHDCPNVNVEIPHHAKSKNLSVVLRQPIEPGTRDSQLHGSVLVYLGLAEHPGIAKDIAYRQTLHAAGVAHIARYAAPGA